MAWSDGPCLNKLSKWKHIKHRKHANGWKKKVKY